VTIAFATATSADVPDILAFHRAVSAYVGTIPGARTWRVPSEDLVERLMKSTDAVVAREDGALVASFRLDFARGFCGVARFTEVESFVYLLEMAVHPSNTRRGIGRLCLEEAERRARARGARAIRLDTNEDALHGATFYAACGYTEVLHFADTHYFERLLPAGGGE